MQIVSSRVMDNANLSWKIVFIHKRNPILTIENPSIIPGIGESIQSEFTTKEHTKGQLITKLDNLLKLIVIDIIHDYITQTINVIVETEQDSTLC